MNLLAVNREYSNEDECLEHLEKVRWPEGISCPTCGSNEVCKGTRKGSAKNKRTRYYQCLEKTCKQQFSAASGTIFHGSHLPLTIWFAAIALITDAKKSMSAMQVQRHLGIGSYRSAWFMCHRIRKAMEEIEPEKMAGIVEMDETYIGGKKRGKKFQGRRDHKQCVIGIKERGGSIRFFHAANAQQTTLQQHLEANVSPSVDLIMTDELRAYPGAIVAAGHDIAKHRTVTHNDGVYAVGIITTNGIESAFSLLKRGIVGSFHWISPKHLHRYLREFEFRFNQRKHDIFAVTMREMMVKLHMPYKVLIG